jgi:nucleoside diphosphate kinase
MRSNEPSTGGGDLLSTDTDDIPEYLTSLAGKWRAYLDDTYFIEAWEDAHRLLRADLPHYCRSHTSLLLKPEALRVGATSRILRWLREHDWIVVAARQVRPDRHTLRGLWWYHWNAFTRQHREVVDLLFSVSASVFLLLRQPNAASEAATYRLAEQKGPSEPQRRRPGQLRTLLGQHNTYLNFVHSPDEPADLFREISVLFEPAQRDRLLDNRLAPVSNSEVLRLAADAVADVDSVSGVDGWSGCGLEDAAAELVRRCSVHGHRSADTRRAIASAVQAARTGDHDGDWRPLRDTLAALDPRLTRTFAFVVLATYLTRGEMPGRRRLVPTVQGRPAGSVRS